MGLLCIMFAASISTGCLTLVGETMRSALILVRRVADFTTSNRIHAGSLAQYEFGVGKLQQAWNLAIGLTMILAGFWLASRAFDLITTDEINLLPRDFAIAATALALVTLRSSALVLADARIAKDRRKLTDLIQYKSDVLRFASLLVVQLLMTVAVLTRDPLVALLADFIGAVFIALLLTMVGAKMSSNALLDLIDHPLSPAEETHIAKVLRHAGIGDRELTDLRSRRSNRHTFVELTLSPANAVSFEETRQRMRRVLRELTDSRDNLDVVIKLRSPTDQGSAK